MSSVVIGGETIGVGVRSRGDGGAAKRAGSPAGGAISCGGAWNGGCCGGCAARRCRMTLVELARAIS